MRNGWAVTMTPQEAEEMLCTLQYAHFVAARAIFADTSFGKTFVMLAAARNVMSAAVPRHAYRDAPTGEQPGVAIDRARVPQHRRKHR